jgi:hypothetical protein
MNRTEFARNYGFFRSEIDTSDVLMTIASTLSDIQFEIEHNINSDERIEKINTLKKFIFEYDDVIRREQREAQL